MVVVCKYKPGFKSCDLLNSILLSVEITAFTLERKSGKVHIFWEGHKILRNLHLTFDCMYCNQKLGEDFANFCGLLRIYELYVSTRKISKFKSILTWNCGGVKNFFPKKASGIDAGLNEEAHCHFMFICIHL